MMTGTSDRARSTAVGIRSRERPNAQSLFIAGLLVSSLAALLVLPAAGAGAATGCTNCAVWEDTCLPFEENNETAYNEKVMAAFAPIAANQTPFADYSNLTWSEAFRSFHALFRERYAFSEQRSVDWDALYQRYTPAIADAERNRDSAAYYRAFREYLTAVPDGHVNVMPSSGEFGARQAEIGGSYGFAVSRLDSGKVIVSYVANGSAAEAAGLRFGDEVTAWNGTEIMAAINATPYIWAVKKPSTAEGILLHRQRLLTRAPVGATAAVTLAGTAGSRPRTVNLTAFDDGYDTLKRTSMFLGRQVNDYGTDRFWTDIKSQISNETITTRTLPGGYTYIAIYDESYEVYQPFKAAMLSAIANRTPGIVIDLRWNSGGDDNLGSCLAGWFVNRTVFYEYATKYDPGLRDFRVVSEAWTAPRPDRYGGPVAVLVSPDTISSGEAIPMVFARTGTGAVVSWYGTNGAFGENNVQAVMPLDLVVYFPDGASLDRDGRVQVDSNASLVGGIPPQVRVPINEETVRRAVAGEDVELAYALQWLDGRQGSAGQPAGTATPARASPPATVVVLAALGLLAVAAGRR